MPPMAPYFSIAQINGSVRRKRIKTLKKVAFMRIVGMCRINGGNIWATLFKFVAKLYLQDYTIIKNTTR
jgi:hypothetical protein